MSTIKILGTSGDVTTCELCGKTNLKKTIVLEIGESVVHYGSDCAGKALYGKKSSAHKSTIERSASMQDKARAWYAKGYSLKVISEGIWNRFGIGSFERNGILIGAGGFVFDPTTL